MSAFSSNPQHLPINAALLDEAVHSDERTFVDRLGRTRRTIKGIELSVSDALTARDEAVLARDAAIAAAGPLYATEAEGRAAVGDGETFSVQGGGDIAAYQYRRISNATSTLITSYPASAAVQKNSEALSAEIYGAGYSDPLPIHCRSLTAHRTLAVSCCSIGLKFRVASQKCTSTALLLATLLCMCTASLVTHLL